MEQNVLERILDGSMKPTNLPLETLREITDGFSVDRIIGEGGFGTVYKGAIRNGSVAVKRIRSSMTIDDKLFRREVDSLMEVNHQNVVQFLGLCSHTEEMPMKKPESRGYIYAEIRERLLCFEYISNGSLDKNITDELRGLEWDKRYQIIKGICVGLHYLHMEKCILHMDLKPANILLDDQMVPKITDFGLSRPTENSQTMSIDKFSTPGYGAPENLSGRGRMSVKSDMYSLGVIIIEVVTGSKGVPDNNNILRRWRHRWNKSAKETPLEYHQQVTKCIEIGLLCQKIDPCARPSISQVMSKFVEMESTHDNGRNANDLTVGQINFPTYWDDGMLGVEPLELQFGHNKKNQILSCSVELINDTDSFIAFKIQTLSPLPYSIEPNKDIVKPRYKGIVRTGNVAVKRIRSSMTIYDKLFRREVDSLMEVNHQNVVRFVGLCSHTVETPMKNPESRGYIYAEIRERLLCFEYISNGSLDKKITDELRGLEWDSRYQIIKGICAGLRYLHMEKCILHMDLKPANILLNNQMVPKITDFGLSRPTENSQTMSINHFSSPGYSAPENLFGRGRMSVKSDMYSLGVIIIELVTGHKDIPDNYNNIIRRWRHRWRKSAKETPLEFQQQVTKCIEISVLCQNIDPLKRPFISEIMSIFDEMESNNNHSRNANESPVFQINAPTHWEDDMLGVEPLEIRFGYSKQKQILSCSVELSNDTDGFIAFKMQTMSPLPYSIKPNRDIVKPRSKCSVDITLPAANTQDHKAARQYSTNKQYTEEFIVRSIEVNGGLISKDINEDMFDKHTVGHHVDEIHLAVVSEESCSKEVMDSGSKQVKKQYAKPDLQWRHTVETTQTPMPTLIGSGTGRVHLAIKSYKWAPFDECNKKVMLELTGADYTIDRPGLDLVAIMDISGSMQGEKMEQLKTAMGFVIRKLSPMDRLSVVTFSNAVMKLCPLQQITEASQRELQKLINELVARGDTNITDGLLAGLNVLFDRKVSRGRVVAIMLMSDGIQTERDAAQVNVGNVPVYTFGFGRDSDPRVLSMIAANSMGGTFSHVQDIGSGGLTMAFSQCLAGLLTVSVQDLKLTVAAIGGESTILKATAGGYPQTHEQDDDDSR